MENYFDGFKVNVFRLSKNIFFKFLTFSDAFANIKNVEI